MKINYEDYLDDDYYEDIFTTRQPRKFKDSERASVGNNFHKKSIRKKRQAKLKQRENKERLEIEEEEGEEEFY